MIIIRSIEGLLEPSLVCLAATVVTPNKVFTMCSNGAIVDHTSPFGGGLFGAMSWPRSRFEIAPGVVLEQQMFLPHDGSGAALSWELRGGIIPARLTIRPLFFGCDPRSYRSTGFQYEPDETGGRLSWLPRVCGPKIIADTNGEYCDEPIRSLDDAQKAELFAPGRFEFELTSHPSILAFSADSHARSEYNRLIGAFLASVVESNCSQSIRTLQHINSRSLAPLVEAAA